MKINQLPAGLFDDHTAELFAAFDKSYCLFNGAKQETSNMPTRVKNAVVDFYKRRPLAERAYEAMVGNNEQAKIDQCVKCMFAKFDNTADMCADGQLTPEVVACSKRGSCKYEGEGCLTVVGVSKLSPAQQRVAQLSHLTAQEIASTLFLSVNTVNRHLQDSFSITGAKNKSELTKMVVQSNLIN